MPLLIQVSPFLPFWFSESPHFQPFLEGNIASYFIIGLSRDYNLDSIRAWLNRNQSLNSGPYHDVWNKKVQGTEYHLQIQLRIGRIGFCRVLSSELNLWLFSMKVVSIDWSHCSGANALHWAGGTKFRIDYSRPVIYWCIIDCFSSLQKVDSFQLIHPSLFCPFISFCSPPPCLDPFQLSPICLGMSNRILSTKWVLRAGTFPFFSPLKPVLCPGCPSESVAENFEIWLTSPEQSTRSYSSSSATTKWKCALSPNESKYARILSIRLLTSKHQRTVVEWHLAEGRIMRRWWQGSTSSREPSLTLWLTWRALGVSWCAFRLGSHRLKMWRATLRCSSHAWRAHCRSYLINSTSSA